MLNAMIGCMILGIITHPLILVQIRNYCNKYGLRIDILYFLHMFMLEGKIPIYMNIFFKEI